MRRVVVAMHEGVRRPGACASAGACTGAPGRSGAHAARSDPSIRPLNPRRVRRAHQVLEPGGQHMRRVLMPETIDEAAQAALGPPTWRRSSSRCGRSCGRPTGNSRRFEVNEPAASVWEATSLSWRRPSVADVHSHQARRSAGMDDRIWPMTKKVLPLWRIELGSFEFPAARRPHIQQQPDSNSEESSAPLLYMPIQCMSST